MFEDCFSKEELNVKAIKNKEGKMAFLASAIQAVCTATGAPPPANPAKIVAGLEAKDTNKFLQLMAVAARGTPVSEWVGEGVRIDEQ